MATLTRPKTAPETRTTSVLLSGGVPTPFPVQQLQRQQPRQQQQQPQSVVSQAEDPFLTTEEREIEIEVERVEDEPASPREGLTDLLPSITTLQKSCLITLNNLLSGSDSEQWKTIVPDRRHSMPASSTSPDFYPQAALQTLVTNLRTRTRLVDLDEDRMIEIHNDNLLVELQNRVREISSNLAPRDAVLATSLVTLLTYFDRLSRLGGTSTTSSTAAPSRPDSANNEAAPPPPIDMFDALTRHLNDVQLDRLSSSQQQQQLPHTSSSSQREVAILWSQIDRELESVVAMCKERTEGLPRFYQETTLPPQYSYHEHEVHGYADYDLESLPEYDGHHASIDESKTKSSPTSTSIEDATRMVDDEKMRLDLEGVAMAIDRLYLVAPQLHNQRVELKSSKLEQLKRLAKKSESDLAVGEGSQSSGRSRSASGSNITKPKKGKEKEKDVKELENLLEMLEKASGRSLKDQAVVLDGGMQRRLEKARQKDLAQREAFVETLLKHSSAGRLHGQDAILHPPKPKDPNAKLTLPEFIRERVPIDSELLREEGVMLSLEEVVRQAPPGGYGEGASGSKDGGANLKTVAGKSGAIGKTVKRKRSRSLSAPPLAWRPWLRQSKSQMSVSLGSGGGSALAGVKEGGTETDKDEKGKDKEPETVYDVVYVAEHHSHLNTMTVVFKLRPSRVGGATNASANGSGGGHGGHGNDVPDKDVEVCVEVLPPFPEHWTEGGDHFVVKNRKRSGRGSGNGGRTNGNGGSNGHAAGGWSWSSLPLMLPARTSPGVQDVGVQRGHWDVKMGTITLPPPVSPSSSVNGTGIADSTPATPPEDAESSTPLLDASQLTALAPTSFICASCSLPLIQTTQGEGLQKQLRYLDLPSEHWEELVEAWMCHGELSLSEEVARRVGGRGVKSSSVGVNGANAAKAGSGVNGVESGKANGKGGKKTKKTGFWPAHDTVWVGGSYLLVGERSVVRSSLVGGGVGESSLIHEDWKICRCLCGAVIGRSQKRHLHDEDGVESGNTEREEGREDEEDEEADTCFRILKYAVRPITASPTENLHLLKIPLSAFVVEDMMEYVHAHASYRFVIRDEEAERARILIWLFKPRMKIAYSTPRARVIRKTASIVAAKVLYKLIGPSEASRDLKSLLAKYPGFPQAEYLSYPMSVCQRLAVLLKESNLVYPEGMREMTGLEVGWLERR